MLFNTLYYIKYFIMETITSDLHIEEQNLESYENGSALPRRSFFKFAALGVAGLAISTSACKLNQRAMGYKLGSGDFAILNMAYALEQMEAAFYTKVTDDWYPGATEMEKDLITDIRNNEIAHREWFRRALFLKKLPQLEFDFSSINFKSRNSVLNTAKEIEDTGVSAYNGAGQYLKVGAFLQQAGDIVSVEARHVATIRNLISFGDYAGSDVIDINGLDGARKPQEIIKLTAKFFKTPLDGSELPNA